jgi:uncharacterized membrane protein
MSKQITEVGQSAKPGLAVSGWIKKTVAAILGLASLWLSFHFLDEAPTIYVTYDMGVMEVVKLLPGMFNRYSALYTVCMSAGWIFLLYAVGYFKAVRNYRKARKQWQAEEVLKQSVPVN